MKVAVQKHSNSTGHRIQASRNYLILNSNFRRLLLKERVKHIHETKKVKCQIKPRLSQIVNKNPLRDRNVLKLQALSCVKANLVYAMYVMQLTWCDTFQSPWYRWGRERRNGHRLTNQNQWKTHLEILTFCFPKNSLKPVNWDMKGRECTD